MSMINSQKKILEYVIKERSYEDPGYKNQFNK